MLVPAASAERRGLTPFLLLALKEGFNAIIERQLKRFVSGVQSSERKQIARCPLSPCKNLPRLYQACAGPVWQGQDWRARLLSRSPVLLFVLTSLWLCRPAGLACQTCLFESASAQQLPWKPCCWALSESSASCSLRGFSSQGEAASLPSEVQQEQAARQPLARHATWL